MVGGKVIGIVRKVDCTTLHVRCTRSTDQICVSVKETKQCDDTRVQISLGDSVWWQGGLVMWTPSGVNSTDYPEDCGKRWDIELPKIGYTHSFSHATQGE